MLLLFSETDKAISSGLALLQASPKQHKKSWKLSLKNFVVFNKFVATQRQWISNLPQGRPSVEFIWWIKSFQDLLHDFDLPSLTDFSELMDMTTFERIHAKVKRENHPSTLRVQLTRATSAAVPGQAAVSSAAPKSYAPTLHEETLSAQRPARPPRRPANTTLPAQAAAATVNKGSSPHTHCTTPHRYNTPGWWICARAQLCGTASTGSAAWVHCWLKKVPAGHSKTASSHFWLGSS